MGQGETLYHEFIRTLNSKRKLDDPYIKNCPNRVYLELFSGVKRLPEKATNGFRSTRLA